METEPAEEPEDFSDVDEDMLREMVEAQREEAQARQREQEIRKLELEKNEREAERALEAQMEDRDRQREHQDRAHSRNQRYGLAVILVGVLFLGFLFWNGHTNTAYEIIRVLILGGGGFAAGKKYGEGVAGGQVSQEQG